MVTTEQPNPYAAPKAVEATAPTDGLSPSLEDAVAGRYDFAIGEVMGEAWELIRGMKASYWGAAIVVGGIYLVVETLAGWALGLFQDGDSNLLVKSVFRGVVGALMTPLTMGIQMMCVRRALGSPVSFGTAFAYLHRGGIALAGALLAGLLSYLGLLLVLPGIYLMVAYAFTTALICERELGAWRAMETSRRAVTHRWFSVFGLFMVVGLLTALSALALLIPLIWTMPWATMTLAVLYRRIFYARPPELGEAAALEAR